MNNARTNGRRAVRESVGDVLWERNEEFSLELREMVHVHRFSHHLIYDITRANRPPERLVRQYHLECGHAFMEPVTEAAIQVMALCSQLKSRLGHKAVCAARFLLQINLLDDIGFRPVVTDDDGYAGSPDLSHFMQFTITLAQLGISIQDFETHLPGREALACRDRFVGDNDQDYTRLICVLALADTGFETLGAWAESLARYSGLDTSQGYYSIPMNEDAADDTWHLFQQTVTPDRYDEMRKLATGTLDIWSGWLDSLLLYRKTNITEENC